MTPRTLPDPRDLLHPDGWPDGQILVRTNEMRLAMEAVVGASLRGRPVAITGVSGTGKTTVASTGAVAADVWWKRIDMPVGPVGKAVEIILLRALIGDARVDRTRTTAQLQDDLQTLFQETRRILVLDEAHRLGARGLDLLRYLWSTTNNKMTIVLVGERLEPLLKDNQAITNRLYSWIPLKPIGAKRLLVNLTQLDPLIVESNAELLLQIDREWAHGIFRNWSNLIAKVHEQNPAATAITPQSYAPARGALGPRW